MSFLISTAQAQEAAAPAANAAPGGEYIQFIFLIGFVVIFYFLIWRPQAKRTKDHKNLIGGLQKGDEVGDHRWYRRPHQQGHDEFVVLEVSDNVELKFQKGAIAATLPKGTLKAL